MMFKCMFEMTELELRNTTSKCTRIVPIHKTLDDDLSADITWIHNNADTIIGSSCDYVWNLYFDYFINEKILSKNNFYKLVKQELNISSAIIRVTNDNVKYCFRKVNITKKVNLK